MSTLRTSNLIHGSSSINNIVLDTQGRAIFGPNSAQGRASLYVNPQNNRVGINNEAPAVALDVDGAINATGNVSFTGDLNIDNGTLFVDSSANYVGIGITTPQRILHVFSAVTDTLALFYSGDADSQINFQDSTSIINGASVGCRGDDFYIRTGLSTTRLTVKSDGNVGINETSPDRKLHVRQDGAYALKVGGESGAEYYLELGQPTTSASPGINYTGTNASLRFLNNGSDVARFDSLGRLLIGTTTSKESTSYLQNISPSDSTIFIASSNISATGVAKINLGPSNNITGAQIICQAEEDFSTGPNRTANLQFFTRKDGTLAEGMRLDSSGRLLVGMSSARAIGNLVLKIQTEDATGSGSGRIAIGTNNNSNSTGPGIYFFRSRGGVLGSNTIVQNGDVTGSLFFQGADGTDLNSRSAEITAEVDGTPGVNDMPGRLLFKTTANGASTPTERMRITNSGVIAIADALDTVTPSLGLANGGIFIRPTTVLGNAPFLAEASSASESIAIIFANNNGLVGSIRTSGSATQYNTSSDYRLKENVVNIADGITRLKQLQPKRFNFIADADTTVDGFIAHEAQAVVPQAVTGTKDEVDDNGNAVMQGIDQSKLIPLLTAALQEAIAKIETLEQRLSDAGL